MVLSVASIKSRMVLVDLDNREQRATICGKSVSRLLSVLVDVVQFSVS